MDDKSRRLIMEEPWGPNTPSEFEDYDYEEDLDLNIGLKDSLDSIELVDFGYSPGETSYPIEENSVERASLIGSFQTVFTEENSPYDENWDYQTTNDFLEWTSDQDYEGLLVIDEGRVVGFAWGYRVDPETVDIEGKFPDRLDDQDQDFYDGETFMIDEVGVMPEYRGNGIGRELESGLLENISERSNISRALQRTQWSGENQAKLGLDNDLSFEVLTYEDGVAEKPVLQEVDFVGTDGSDERAYLWRDVRGELE